MENADSGEVYVKCLKFVCRINSGHALCWKALLYVGYVRRQFLCLLRAVNPHKYANETEAQEAENAARRAKIRRKESDERSSNTV